MIADLWITSQQDEHRGVSYLLGRSFQAPADVVSSGQALQVASTAGAGAPGPPGGGENPNVSVAGSSLSLAVRFAVADSFLQNRTPLDRLVDVLDEVDDPDEDDDGSDDEEGGSDDDTAGVRAAPNQGGDGVPFETMCKRCVRRIARSPAQYRRHRCSHAESGGGLRCQWCAHNNKGCEIVSLLAPLCRFAC